MNECIVPKKIKHTIRYTNITLENGKGTTLPGKKYSAFHFNNIS